MSFDRVALTLTWVVLLVVVAVLVRVLRLLRTNEAALEEMKRYNDAEELEIGTLAPGFSAEFLDRTPADLSRLSGPPTLLLFVSPACATCRREMREFVRLSRTIRERSGLHTVLVTDQRAERSVEWFEAIRTEDGVSVELPVLSAPPRRSDLLLKYNPSGVMPSFCVIGADRRIQSRGRVGEPTWFTQRAIWEGRPPGARPRDLRRATS